MQALPAGLHVPEDFPLPVVERSQLFILQQFDVAVQDGQRGLKVVGGRCQGIGGAQGALPQLVVLLQQFVVAEGIAGGCLARQVPPSRVAAPVSPERHVFSGTTPICGKLTGLAYWGGDKSSRAYEFWCPQIV